ncbi:hypothetical protein Leryth_009787 [Lithospermum erythrorhizon]|nr:hypothetical protein Leryth_009787 [Lithospermum erythrorhizon]
MSGAGTPDFYYREALRLGYVARSAFKSLGALKNGGAVVGIDTKKVKVPSAYCDARVKTVCGDVFKLQKDQIRALSPKEKGFSVILSDMCPLVSGITTRDAALSAELGMQALSLAVGEKASAQSESDNIHEQSDSPTSLPVKGGGILLRGGHLVIKLLESEDVKEFSQICKPLFRKAVFLRPKATRSCSRETYLICQGLQ